MATFSTLAWLVWVRLLSQGCGDLPVSHVIVDEVHERSIDSDFLLTILRGVLARRPELKLILMSATLNAHLFQAYFARIKGGAAVVDIPGRSFPVERFFLEDVVARTQYEVARGSEFARDMRRGGGARGGGGGGRRWGRE